MKGNLLLVDDEPLLLKRLRASLEEHADAVYIASNGIEALEVLEHEKIDCVVCDVNMPKLNGIEVIKKVRARNLQIPFIFFTGHGNETLMMEVAKYGAYDFFNKPNFDGLEEAVKRGLHEGFTKQKSSDDEQSIISEYQKLLQTLK